MLYGVIDVGSNSVRLMMSDGTQTLYKKVKTTKLAEGMTNGYLAEDAINRTANAVLDFVNFASEQSAEKIFIFATAAVRTAINSKKFTDLIYNSCGLFVDVVSGQKEAELGLIGALNGKDGGIIDVGGASSEVAVVLNEKITYSKSIRLGAVSLKDECGQDRDCAESLIERKIEEYGSILKTNFYAIGGTATSVAAMLLECEPYDPKKVNGFIVDRNSLLSLNNKLYSMSVAERKKLKGLQPERAEVIAGGTLILLKIMDKIGIDKFIVSESDNLEGYLISKMESK